jgi:hypothetical protein
MKRVMIVGGIAVALTLGAMPGTALAGGSGFVKGAASGAVTGAVVGGPVGAAVGGVAGAIVGGALEPPPPEVVTYVREQPVPADPVVVQQKIVVGQPLPETVQVVAVPDSPKYAYAVINHERVIVDSNTRTVVQVIQ